MKIHEAHSESLKDISFKPEGIESMIKTLLKLLYQTHLLNLQSG